MTAFDRLSPAFQHQVVYTLGFRALRPVQELTIDAVLDEKNCVVLAPTAGGKTEAAFFPLLSAMDAADWRPVSVVYLSPIRALLNNQEPRLERYAATLGRRVFKWHGDTPPTARRAFLREPADILLTTPESLEAMMMSPKVPTGALFGGLRAVVLDEVHAFAGSDRGAHLAAVLERLVRLCRKDVQRIGLSATVGNPEEILRWLQGSSKRNGVVVRPPGARTPPKLELDHVGNVANAATVIRRLHPGKKRLVFVDSRRGCEDLAKHLRTEGVTTHVLHGSLSAGERRDAERAFQEGSDCVIVATSALELGIDVGDLDHVLQVDTPSTVSSFLQRMGRTGRRPGTVPNCTFLVAKHASILQATALLSLHDDGFVEPVAPSERAFHILAHQLLALSIQQAGVARSDWFGWLEGATPFGKITAPERQALLDHMLAKEILSEQDGRLWLGQTGERIYGRKNFSELYAVFSVPALISVEWGDYEVGTVDANFLQGMKSDDAACAFVLAGRSWEVVTVDWKRGVCVVKPAPQGVAPRWFGTPQFLGYELCQRMRRILVEDGVAPYWTRRMQEAIAGLRAEHGFLRDERSPMVADGKGVTWWTFAGGRANSLLARVLEEAVGGKFVVRNTCLTWAEKERATPAALREATRRLAASGRPTAEDALRHAEGTAGKARMSKFQECLPAERLNEYLAGCVFDVNAARACLS